MKEEQQLMGMVVQTIQYYHVVMVVSTTDICIIPTEIINCIIMEYTVVKTLEFIFQPLWQTNPLDTDLLYVQKFLELIYTCMVILWETQLK